MTHPSLAPRQIDKDARASDVDKRFDDQRFDGSDRDFDDCPASPGGFDCGSDSPWV